MTSLGLTADVRAANDNYGGSETREESYPRFSHPHPVYDEQIQGLVQQLFFHQDPAAVRHVGFAALEQETETARLCLNVALALAETGSHDIGLIDARLRSRPLHGELDLPAGNRPEASWLIADRLWLAPRRRWLDENGQHFRDPSLTRLRNLTLEFDFSIVCLDPASWLTARLSQTCHGLVMVLTANKTRRLVATEMQEQLRRARVPLLGTVLAERRFPVPDSLYRNL
jgi:Mrp family chromosome partitioning ATPase